MITIYKGNTGNAIITTFYERLNYYGLSGGTGQTFYFSLSNDTTKQTYNFSLVDSSANPWRYNSFTLNETTYDFTNGSYSYSGYANSDHTQLLEEGRLIVSGTNTTDSIYW